MNKVTYTGNDLAREVPTMREPDQGDDMYYTERSLPGFDNPITFFSTVDYKDDVAAYKEHLASLQTFPVLTPHNWIIGQTYEEGRDYEVQEQIYLPTAKEWINKPWGDTYGRDERTVLQPIVKQANPIPQPYTGEFLHFILVNVLRGLDQDQQRELIRKISERLPIVNDVAKKVCYCGSLRVALEAFKKAEYEAVLNGEIALLPCCMFVDIEREYGAKSDYKQKADELHKRKIDIADEVFILNVGGYIGESTRNEINYALSIGKPVKYLDGVNDVASDSKASPSLASHSCTETNLFNNKTNSMKREIKFRLWHVEEKKMFSYDLMWGRSGQSGSGWIDAVPFGEAKESRLFHQGNQVGIDPHECEIMQYTGRKDENGKEIYEGDVIASPWMERDLFYKIVFWNGSFQAEEINNPIPDSENHVEYLWNICQASEIIGNIYENPELINQANENTTPNPEA